MINWLKTTLLGAKLLLPFFILAAALVAYGTLKALKPNPKPPKQVEKVWPVYSKQITAETITPTLKLYGKTVAGRQVELRALVAGEIIKTGPALKEGALVKKGEMLVTIDEFDYQGALKEARAFLIEAKARSAELKASIKLEQANLKYAETQLALAEKDYKRAAALAKRGTVTKKLADDRRVILSQRQQAVTGHQINLDLQTARLQGQTAVVERLTWKVTQAERRLAETKLVAPFDAYVSAVNAEIGRTVNVNDRIANLIDRGQIDVRFTLTDAQYGRILAYEKTLIGRTVKLFWKVGDTPLAYRAVIKRIGAEISSETGGVEVFATIVQSQKAATIRTGAFVEIEVQDRRYDNVFLIPQTALYQGEFIYLIKDGRLEPAKVDVVGAAGNDKLIKAPIANGTEILASRLTLAGKGVRVKPMNNPPAAHENILSQNPKGKQQQDGKATKGL